MNWYRIDFRYLVDLILPGNPILLRNNVIKYFLYSIVAPVAYINSLFASHRNDVAYKISHNSQVCYLQAVLNDYFDFVSRRIYITDADVLEWSRFLWRESEDKPIMLGTFLLGRENFIGADSIDFVVHIPADLNLSNDNYNRMNSIIRYYKLASKRYIIETI